MASLSRSELPEEIEKAIDRVVLAAHAHIRAPNPIGPELEAYGQLRDALTAAILSRLANGAPASPSGSQASPEAPTDPRPSGVDPSRMQWLPIATAPTDGTTVVLGYYDDDGAGGRDWFTPEGQYVEGYMPAGWYEHDYLERVYPTHWVPKLRLPPPPAQGTEARSAETERLGPKDDGPVAEGHAPALTEALARVERLEKALRPFAEAADNLEGNEREDQHLWESPEAMMLSVGDLRAARSALSEPTPASKDD